MKPKSTEIFIPGPAGRLEAKYYKNPKFGSAAKCSHSKVWTFPKVQQFKKPKNQTSKKPTNQKSKKPKIQKTKKPQNQSFLKEKNPNPKIQKTKNPNFGEPSR